MKKLIIRLLLLAAPSISMAAGPFYVLTNGNDSANGLAPATAWATLAHAVSAAGSGSTIYVGAGNYNTNAVSNTPLHLTTANQTFLGSNGVVTKQLSYEAAGVVISNFVVGKNHFGGFVNDPVVRFRVGSTGSQILGGTVYSTLGFNQYGILFEDTNCAAYAVGFTNFGPSGVVIDTSAASRSNRIDSCFIRDCPSVEGVFYFFGMYNAVQSCVVSNVTEAALPGSHPDLFQAFFDTSYGHSISNNLFINNSCQFGSLQAVDGPGGGTYKTNTGNWKFLNNVFINTGSKLDVDFANMQFYNNTFYNNCNASDASHIINFNFSTFGVGTNGVLVNNLFAINGSDPTAVDQGWFAVSEGTNTSNIIRNSMLVSNNMVLGSAFATKTTNLLIGASWINGGNPKFVSAPSSRIHVLDIAGVTGANQATNIFGTNGSFTTQLAVGDRITLGPYWTGAVARVVKIINATNLWVDSPIGTGVSTKFGGPQSIQRCQGYDPVPDLRQLFGSPAIDAGATLAVNPYDNLGVSRPVGPRYDIGAYEGNASETAPINLVMWLSFLNWGGLTNVLDVTTNHNDGKTFLTTPWKPTVGFGPDGGNGVHLEPNGFFGVTNLSNMRNLTNGSVTIWASRTNGVGNLYSYLLDCGFTFPATNGFTLGADNGNATKLFVTSPGSARITVLTYPDFGSTNYNHYGFTWSNSTCVGYFNGLPFQTNSLPAAVLTMDNADWLAVGVIQHDEQPGSPAFTNAATAFVRGDVTDIRYYNTSLSDSDILNIYNVHALPPAPVIPPATGGSLPPQLLMHLTFTGWNGSSNVLDQTTNRADGISVNNTNGPTLATGPYGTNTAGHFATSQYLAVTNTPVFDRLTNGSISIWVKYDNHVGSGDYYAMDGFYGNPDTNCWTFGAPNGNVTQFRSVSNSGSFTNMSFSDWNVITNWHHYAITWDNTNIMTWYDGALAGTIAKPFPFFHVESTAKWLSLGVFHGSHVYTSPSSGWLQGSLADIRIYNYALTSSNVFRLSRWQEPIGAETTYRNRGTRVKDIYENVFVEHGDPEAGHWRSGSGIWVSNTIVSAVSGFNTRNYRLAYGGFWGYANGTNAWDVNDPTIYGAGIVTSANSVSMTDSSATWTPHAFIGKSVRNVGNGQSSIILDNTATSLTFLTPATSSGNLVLVPGNTYQIRRVITVLDEVGRGQGLLMSNATPVIAGIAQNPQQALDPVWQWSNTLNGASAVMDNGGYYSSVVGQEIRNEFNPNWRAFQYPHPLVSGTNAIQLPPPVFTKQPSSTNIYVTQTALFTVTATSDSTITYQWKTNGVNAGTNGPALSVGPAVIGWSGMAVICVAANTNGATTSSSATLTVLPDPTITAQPTNVTVSVGATATFTVTASGQSALTYQWKKNGSTIAGATLTTYTTPLTVTGDNNSQFLVVVTDTAGSLQSASATLTVVGPDPVITSQPQSTNIFATQTALFRITAGGASTLSYQWKTNGVNAGTNGPALAVGPAPVAWSGMTILCVVTDTAGSLNSSTATLTVGADPVISTQPVSATTGVGLTASFNVVATGQTTISYQWQRNGSAVAGATLSSYTTPAMTGANNGDTYAVTVSDIAGSLLSGNATLTVTNIVSPPDPVITSQPQSTNIFAAQSALFTITATGNTTLAYQWKTNNVNTGTNGPAFSIGPCPVAWDGISVLCVVSDVAGSATSSTATLGVGADPVISSQPANKSVSVGNTATFSVTATGQTALSYQWSKNGSTIGGATLSAYTTPATVLADNGSQFFVTVTDTAGSLQSANATLTVIGPDPIITSQPQSTNIYTSQVATFSLTAAGATTLTYQWKTNGVNAGTNGPVLVLPPAPTVWNGMTVLCVITDTAGSLTSSTATLTVSPDPVIVTSPQNVSTIVGAVASFNVSATGQSALSYQWYRNGVTVSGATLTSYTTPTLAFGNNGDTYAADVHDTASTVRSATATLTVQHKPAETNSIMRVTHGNVKLIRIGP